MTPLLAISQRVVIDPPHGERRDALDHRWLDFLAACGMVPLPLPNRPDTALDLLGRVKLCGLLLTGGNSLESCGGDAPERDRTEREALAFARRTGLPVLGVCRGMQMLLDAFAVPLVRIDGHAGCHHPVDGAWGERTVNSYHDFAACTDAGPLAVLARSLDGAIEAVEHPDEPIRGIMWHPERSTPFEAADIALMHRMFNGRQP
jgi:putative glutamine amidotransferase